MEDVETTGWGSRYRRFETLGLWGVDVGGSGLDVDIGSLAKSWDMGT